MAFKNIGRFSSNILRQSRNYSEQAAFQQKTYGLPCQQPESAVAPNGVLVSTHENNSPLSRVSLVVKAGSRYETEENFGVSKLLEKAGGAKTENVSSFLLTRQTRQWGGSLVCTSDREYIYYTITLPKDYAVGAVEFLMNIANRPLFRRWEVVRPEDYNRIETDRSSRTPCQEVMNLLYRAAFRNCDLGQSDFPAEYAYKKISIEMLKDFHEKTHTSRRMAVIGLGVELNAIYNALSPWNVREGPDCVGSAKYAGGDVRQFAPVNLAHVAVAGPGAKIGSADAASFAVAQHIIGTGCNVLHGSGVGSKLGAALHAAGNTGHAGAFNESCSDAGLFGIYISATPDEVEGILKTALNVVRSLKVTDEDVALGKKAAKTALMRSLESSCTEMSFLRNSIINLSTFNLVDMTTAIDKVTASSVQKALTNSMTGKVSMSAYGSISKVPYIEDI